MQYRTVDYLRDSYWFIEMPINLWGFLKPRLKKFLDKAIDFEYDKYIFRIAENLPYALVILFLGLFAVLTLAKYSEKQNGIRVTTITTNSMYPAIAPGSIIISTPTSIYSKGDIITYKEINPKTGVETGRAITHRIISEGESDKDVIYVTQGDANKQPDPGNIKKEQIFGKVFMIVPFLGYFDIVVKTLPGFTIFIVIPALLLIRNELNFLKEEKRYSLKKSDFVGL